MTSPAASTTGAPAMPIESTLSAALTQGAAIEERSSSSALSSRTLLTTA
jgi:hypothetical protein